jgi:hypothetical protein
LGDQLNTTGLTFSRATNTDREALTTRYDWTIKSSHSVEGVFAYKKESNLRNDVDGQQGLTVASTACWNSRFIRGCRAVACVMRLVSPNNSGAASPEAASGFFAWTVTCILLSKCGQPWSNGTQRAD